MPAAGTDNAFDLIRLVAATAVVASHSLALTGHRETLGRESLGSAGVAVFFATSGYLVTGSWVRRVQVWPFVTARALRLLPALAVVLLLSAYALGPAVTTLGSGDYLRSAQTHDYVWHNLLFHTDYLLPGVFADVPFPHVVNGGLWTLALEVKCYLLVLLVGVAARWVGRTWLSGALVVVVLLALTGAIDRLPHGGVLTNWPGHGHEGIADLGAFATGALLHDLRERVPLRADLALAALVVWAATVAWPVHDAATVLLVPYIVLVAAYRAPAGARTATRGQDISYGLYLIGFPVQQTLAHALDPGPALMFVLALGASVPLALASWRLVERPALALKP